MKTKTQTAILTTFVVLLLVGVAAANDGTYDSSVTLENKDGDPNWNIYDDGISAVVDFNNVSDEFDWHAYGVAPLNGTEYVLIYYADKPDRKHNYGGDNPGAFIASMNTNSIGEFDNSGSVDLGINMPESPDYNMNPDPWDEYCNESGKDGYDNCCGAKLWIIPAASYNITSKKVVTWDTDNFLFETDLIWYDDTSHNLLPEIHGGSSEYDDYQAGDTVNITVKVCDNDGIGDINSVTMNFTEYGIDVIEMELLEANGCTCATYTGSVVITEVGEICCEVVATDSSGEFDNNEVCFDVSPGDPDHLNITNMGYDKLLMWEYEYINIESFPDTPWWNYKLYATSLTVNCEDEYGNIVELCCDPIVSTTGHASIIPFEYPSGTSVIVYNHAAVETCTISARCENSHTISGATCDIEFLEPIIQVNLSSDDGYLYNLSDECTECEPDCTTVYAQILDDSGDPISMPNVPVQFSAHEYNGALIYPSVNYTNENGVAETNLCIYGEDIGTVYVYGQAEGRSASIDIDVIEPVIGNVVITNETGCDPDTPMMFGDEQQLSYRCSTDHGTYVQCSGGTWSCDDLGEINETIGNYTAGNTEGVAVVEVNVSGVIGTAEIVINGLDCDTYSAMAEAGVPGTMESGTVSITWNFTGNGTVCVQALGDPMPEWSNDTKGAIVCVESQDNPAIEENVTLDMNGTGNVWMYNDTTGNWSFYAEGDTCVVYNGILQKFALVTTDPTPDPDPEPTPTARRHYGGGGGGGGSGTYPPDMTGADPNVPAEDVDDKGPATKDKDDKPAKDTNKTPVKTLPKSSIVEDVTEATNDSPGFSGLFVILGILAVAYLVYRKRD